MTDRHHSEPAADRNYLPFEDDARRARREALESAEANRQHIDLIDAKLTRLLEAREGAWRSYTGAIQRLADSVPYGHRIVAEELESFIEWRNEIKAGVLAAAKKALTVSGPFQILNGHGGSGRRRPLPSAYRESVPPDFILDLPHLPGVYVLFYNGDVVYVGRSKGIRHRVNKHWKEGSKTFDRCEFHVEQDEERRADLEAILIDQYAPRMNRRGEKRNGAAA